MSKLQLYPASAFLLVYHGSRDPRPGMICNQLANYFQQKLDIPISDSQNNYSYLKKNTRYHSSNLTLESSPIPLDRVVGIQTLVETVALELTELPLHQNILLFAQKAIAMGQKNLVIIPLFLSLGIHVKQDIPSEIALAQTQLPQQITIHLSPPLGSYSGLETLLLDQFNKVEAARGTMGDAGLGRRSQGEGAVAEFPSPTLDPRSAVQRWSTFDQFSPSERILLAHGSRLATANRKTAYLARQCGAQVAYWSKTPHLEAVVQQQMQNNPKKIAIIPYFLFPGRITDAIAQQVAQLQPQFPSTDLILGQPLGATETLAQLILDNITA